MLKNLLTAAMCAGALLTGCTTSQSHLTVEQAERAVETSAMFSADACTRPLQTGQYSVDHTRLDALKQLAYGGFITLVQESTTDSMTLVSVALTPEGMRFEADGSSYLPDQVLSDNDLRTALDIEAMVQSEAMIVERNNGGGTAAGPAVHHMVIGRFELGKVEEILPDNDNPAEAKVVFTYRFIGETPFGKALGAPEANRLRQAEMTLDRTADGWVAVGG